MKQEYTQTMRQYMAKIRQQTFVYDEVRAVPASTRTDFQNRVLAYCAKAHQ